VLTWADLREGAQLVVECNHGANDVEPTGLDMCLRLAQGHLLDEEEFAVASRWLGVYLREDPTRMITTDGGRCWACGRDVQAPER
jgi:hypothetical protein